MKRQEHPRQKVISSTGFFTNPLTLKQIEGLDTSSLNLFDIERQLKQCWIEYAAEVQSGIEPFAGNLHTVSNASLDDITKKINVLMVQRAAVVINKLELANTDTGLVLAGADVANLTSLEEVDVWMEAVAQYIRNLSGLPDSVGDERIEYVKDPEWVKRNKGQLKKLDNLLILLARRFRDLTRGEG